MSNLFEGMEKPFLPMLISNWIFGIGIIEYPIRQPRKVISFIYTSVILSSFLYLNYVSYLYYNVTTISKKNPVTNAIFYYSNIFVTASVLVAGWFQSKGLHKCMVNAAVSNFLLQSMGIQKNHSKILKNELLKFLTFFGYIIAVITINCAITVYDRTLIMEEIISLFVQNFPVVVVFIADSSFMNILGYAHEKFESLNEMFQTLLTSTEQSPLYWGIAKQISTTCVQSHNDHDVEEKDYTFIIRKGKLVHLQLTKLCQEGNKTYGFHILISIIVAFTMMINNLFNIYLGLRSTVPKIIKVKEIIRSLNWFFYFWIKTTINSQFYTTVSRSANKSGDIIGELYDEHSVNEITKAEIRRFNIELIQNKLKLTACGIVKIDLTLIPTMIATIGTYFIIIMQFQKVDFKQSEYVKNSHNYVFPS